MKAQETKTKIVLHCSDSGFGNAALIAKWHTEERQWKNIGYHYVILNGHLSSNAYHAGYNGHIETGRPLDSDPFIQYYEKGAHVRGHNFNSVGICLIGKTGQFTSQQIESAKALIYTLENQFGEIELYQHSELDHKKPYCAGLDMKEFREDYRHYCEQKAQLKQCKISQQS